MINITDLTKYHTGKWYEVGYFCTNDEKEEITIVAKFIDKIGALFYVMWYNENYKGLTRIIVR